MNEELQPRPPSDRDLTLTAISLTFQRARAVQRKLSGPPAWGDHGGDGSGAGDGGRAATEADADIDDSPSPGGRSAEPIDLRAMELDDDGADDPELPNPLVTDANLRHFMDTATANQGPMEAQGLRRFKPRRNQQARYNAAIVHALHQLDHRTRLQQRTITRLEAELADARRILAGIDDDEGSGPGAGGTPGRREDNR